MPGRDTLVQDSAGKIERLQLCMNEIVLFRSKLVTYGRDIAHGAAATFAGCLSFAHSLPYANVARCLSDAHRGRLRDARALPFGKRNYPHHCGGAISNSLGDQFHH